MSARLVLAWARLIRRAIAEDWSPERLDERLKGAERRLRARVASEESAG